MINESQFFEAAASAMVERGLATPEQVATDRAALAAELGGQAPPVPSPAQSTAGSLGIPQSQPADSFDPAAELDAKVFAGAASPAEYNFGPLPEGVEPSPEGLQQESAFRTLFYEEGIPASIGNEVARLWNQAAANPPTPEQLEQARQDGSVMLHRLWGDSYEKNMAVARSEYQRLAQKSPKLPEMLAVSGLGNNPFLITSLVNMALARGKAR